MLDVPRWLPNAISCVRIALVPVWAAFAELGNRAAERGEEFGDERFAATATLVAIGASDVVDGFLARRFGLESRLGATLDAVADKLAQVVVVTYLALRAGPAFVAIPWWFLAVLVGRDVVLATGCAIIRRQQGGVRVVHRPHGKLASLLLFFVLVAFSAGFGADVGASLLLAIAVLVVWSTALYFRDGWRQLDRPPREPLR